MRVQEGFGHDHFPKGRNPDMAEFDLNNLPEHVKSLDVSYLTHGGELYSSGKLEEYFILMEKNKGKEYFIDLEKR